jgi:hypothetical protein
MTDIGVLFEQLRRLGPGGTRAAEMLTAAAELWRLLSRSSYRPSHTRYAQVKQGLGVE